MSQVERIAAMTGRPEAEVEEKLKAAIAKATSKQSIIKANVSYDVQIPECPQGADQIEHFIEHVAPQYQKLSAAKQFNFCDLTVGVRLNHVLHNSLKKTNI